MEFADCLKKNREGILRSIDPQGDLLMYMLSEKLVNYDDREEVKGRRSRRAMAEMILNLVAEKSVRDETVKERFIRCLQRSGQQHIVALLDEESIAAEVRPMTEGHHDVILTQLVHLVRSMDLEGDLLCQLRSRGVLDDREIDRIRNQRSADEMNEVLLTEILPLKSDSAFQDLVSALRASGQPHVANLLILDITCDEIPMSSTHRQFLSANSSYLTEHMDPRYGLIPLMIERCVISYRDSDRIQGKQTSSAMNEFILRLLVRKPDSSFQKFIKVLEDSCQSHVLTNCYGHNIEIELKLKPQDPLRLNEAESAIEKELLSKLSNVDGNTIEEIRRNCIKLKLRCHSKEAFERLITRTQGGYLDHAFLEPIRQILDARGITFASLVASIDPNELYLCLQRFNQHEMSEEHRRYLTVKEFEAEMVTDDTMLEILCNIQALRYEEFQQIKSQLTMDQRREKLFDTLKRKPDSRFTALKDLFDIYATREPSLANLNSDTKKFPYSGKNFDSKKFPYSGKDFDSKKFPYSGKNFDSKKFPYSGKNYIQPEMMTFSDIMPIDNINELMRTERILQSYGGNSSNLLSLYESENI